MKILRYTLTKYDEHYYKIYDRALTRDFNAIPSFRLLNKYIDLKPGEILLDAGCGVGHQMAFFLGGSDAFGIGVDISSSAVSLAASRFPECKFSRQNLCRLAIKDNIIDKVVCFNVIEHISEQDAVMQEFLRILRPGGRLIIGTNIRNSLAWKLYQWTIGEHTHVREFTVDEFVEFLKRMFTVDEYKKSSGVFRFGPPLSWIFHYILLGDVIVLCKKLK